MEDLYDILFEVSNEDRHEILHRLKKKPYNFTQIAKVQSRLQRVEAEHAADFQRHTQLIE